MSSSGPGGTRRNAMCHTAARKSPMMTTRRANLGVANNSRIAKRYAIPASVKEAMKYGPPRSPKLREQIVIATHNAAPSRYTLHAGVIFTITILQCRTELVPTPGTSPYTINERNRDFSSTENKLMNSGGKIFVKGKEPQFPVLPPTVLGVTVT